MSTEIDAGNREEPVVDLLATFQSRAHGLAHDFGVLDEERWGQLAALREEFAAYKQEVCELKAGRVWLRRVVSESRSAEAALKEEVTQLRSALDSERLERAAMEWKLDNLAEDFEDLVAVLREQGLVPQVPEFEAAKKREADEGASGPSQLCEPLAGGSSEGKEAGDE